MIFFIGHTPSKEEEEKRENSAFSEMLTWSQMCCPYVSRGQNRSQKISGVTYTFNILCY